MLLQNSLCYNFDSYPTNQVASKYFDYSHLISCHWPFWLGLIETEAQSTWTQQVA